MALWLLKAGGCQVGIMTELLLHAVGDSRPPGPAGVRLGRLGSVDRNEGKISVGPLLLLSH